MCATGRVIEDSLDPPAWRLQPPRAHYPAECVRVNVPWWNQLVNWLKRLRTRTCSSTRTCGFGFAIDLLLLDYQP